MKFTTDFSKNILFWLVYKTFRVIPFSYRSKLLGIFAGYVIERFPRLRRRVDSNILRVYPDLSLPQRDILRRHSMRLLAQTCGEILYNREYKKRVDLFHISGAGIEILKTCRDNGRGALILTGHLGQWEACRHGLRHHGIKIGVVYKKTRNNFFNRYQLRSLMDGGLPVIEVGYKGTRKLYKALQTGKIIAMMVDQYDMQGENVSFLGHPAMMSTVAARLALRLNIPMIPIFTRRQENGLDINIDIQAPITPSDPRTMSLMVYKKLENYIHHTPEQWFWAFSPWVNKKKYK